MKKKIVKFFKDEKVQKEIVTWTVFIILVLFYSYFFGKITENLFHKRVNAFLFGVAFGMGLMIISIMITEIIYRVKRKKQKSFDKLPCKHPMKYRFIDRDGKQRCSSCHKVIEK